MGNIPAAQTLNYIMNETQDKDKQLWKFYLPKKRFLAH